MKVIFLESVEGTAQVGEVREVKNGFARNYLLPRGLAAPAIEPYIGRAKSRAIREAKHQEVLDEEATGVAERLEGSRITIVARVGEQGKLYGSVTALHIAQEVAQLIGTEEFDHRKVLLPEAIKEVGIQPIRLRLTRNIEASIELEVQAEGADEEEEEAAEGAEAAEEDQPEGEAPESADEGQPAGEETDAAADDEPKAELEEAESTTEVAEGAGEETEEQAGSEEEEAEKEA